MVLRTNDMKLLDAIKNSRHSSNTPVETEDGTKLWSPLLINYILNTSSEEEDTGILESRTELMLPLVRKAQDQAFKIVMFKARQRGVNLVSIGENDIITDDIIYYEERDSKPFAFPFAWDIVRFLDMKSSCGNGLGKGIYQYQITGSKHFHRGHYGIWDTKTEERVSDSYATLNDRAIFCHLLEVVKNAKPSCGQEPVIAQ